MFYSRFAQSSAVIWCIRFVLLDSRKIIFNIVTLITCYFVCHVCFGISQSLSVFRWGLHHFGGLSRSETKAYFSGKICTPGQLAVLQGSKVDTELISEKCPPSPPTFLTSLNVGISLWIVISGIKYIYLLFSQQLQDLFWWRF